MVLLTITPAIQQALLEIQAGEDEAHSNNAHTDQESQQESQASVETAVGKPISHGQVIDIARNLRSRNSSTYTLDALLRASRVYIPPPPPKPEPTAEYKALMARLRREEEARAYERMINPAPPVETFSQRFPASSAANAFTSYDDLKTKEEDDDEVVYQDINKQMMLIFNVLVSIVACSAAIWIMARYWSVPARLGLSMSGGLVVGIAEVAVYAGYIRRIGEAKEEAKKVKEVKEIVKTWVVGEDEDQEKLEKEKPEQEKPKGTAISQLEATDSTGLRARKPNKDFS